MSVMLTVIAIAIASNLDNAGVGIAYGVRRIRFSWLSNLTISVISGLATLAAGAAGHVVTRYIPPKFAGALGATVMIAVGVWVLLEPIRERRVRNRHGQVQDGNVVKKILRDPAYADFDNSNTISFKEALVLGTALALNALAGGFDAGIVHISVAWTALAVAAASSGLLSLSDYVGRRYAARMFGAKATVIAGVLLIFIGVFQIY